MNQPSIFFRCNRYFYSFKLHTEVKSQYIGDMLYGSYMGYINIYYMGLYPITCIKIIKISDYQNWPSSCQLTVKFIKRYKLTIKTAVTCIKCFNKRINKLRKYNTVLRTNRKNVLLNSFGIMYNFIIKCLLYVKNVLLTVSRILNE